ncbi:hypothetical protein GC173_07720 [bacterium]|nr:hypothetical protein [bacterium]
MSDLANDLSKELVQFDREREEKIKTLKDRAQARLMELDAIRIKLDQEEIKLREFLNMPARSEKGARKKQRASGKRTSSAAKAEVIAKFVADGHIRNGGKLTPELRTALKDAGFKPYDLAKIGKYLPAGWSAKSNGARGLLAETIFSQG